MKKQYKGTESKNDQLLFFCKLQNNNMGPAQTYSWIFLALALVCQRCLADTKDISAVADGIGHAVPTHKEMQRSLSWLMASGLITKHQRKYELSAEGKAAHDIASENSEPLFTIWKNLEIMIQARLELEEI